MEKERHGEDPYIGRCMEKCAGFGWRLRLRGRRVRKIETLRRFRVPKLETLRRFRNNQGDNGTPRTTETEGKAVGGYNYNTTSPSSTEPDKSTPTGRKAAEKLKR